MARAAQLPKADRAIIAAHEAGMHDRKPTPATCRLCAMDASAQAVLGPLLVLTGGKSRGNKLAPAPRAVPRKAPVSRPVEQPAKVEQPIEMPEPLPGDFVPGEDGATFVIPVTETREAWMLRAVEAMRPWFPKDAPVPAVRISVGWPGGRGSKKGVRGQCWIGIAVADGTPAIFVSPDQDDPLTIAGIILHEMVHAAGAHEHKSAFAKLAAPLGFVKPWTTSEGKTPELKARLEALLAELGPFPHSPINKTGGLLGILRPPVQSTRMLKLECPECGYSVRTTRKWIDQGLPSCPDGDEMREVS